MARAASNKKTKQVTSLKHDEAKRKNIPTAEHQAVVAAADQEPIRIALARRNRDLDPQLVWRGKDAQNESSLEVDAPPLFIQEKVHPKALIDDLMKHSKPAVPEANQLDLFSDFNGIPEGADSTEFYLHDARWSNRMILGDSLQVMTSLAEREGLRGKVQCIFVDPPYGIKFNSNFQWSTTNRDVKDGKSDHITREPEQVKAFRDTWRDGIHSYLAYLRDRLLAARELLTESGSVFVQIGDENVHRVRALMDEVFGPENFKSEIAFAKTTSSTSNELSGVFDYVLWYARDAEATKFNALFRNKIAGGSGGTGYTRVLGPDGSIAPVSRYRGEDGEVSIPDGFHLVFPDSLRSQSPGSRFDVMFGGKTYRPEPNYWKTDEERFARLLRAGRITGTKTNLSYLRRFDDFPAFPLSNLWTDTVGQNQFGGEKIYVVQTGLSVVQRCMLMATDPGDLVLDPTCGSGTTAYVAEQWGRRWITIDTSRVAIALSRARLMGARYPYYLLADSREGMKKEASVSGKPVADSVASGDIRLGFVHDRVPHITLKSIANNSEIDVIYDEWEPKLESIRSSLNKELAGDLQDWEIPRDPDEEWTDPAKALHAQWWDAKIACQTEIDDSIARTAEFEPRFDSPFEDKSKVRVAGPFTVESVSPHRTLGVGPDDELIDPFDRLSDDDTAGQDFGTMVLENLATAGVQQAHKDDRIEFSSLVPWPGDDICAEGRYLEAPGTSKEREKRAAIFIGPEFGTVTRPQVAGAAREAAEAGFEVLITCAFAYDAHTADLTKIGSLEILEARMNADLHMAGDLKNTGKGNLFVVFGEPDIEVFDAVGEDAEEGQLQVRIHGVDVFDPATGKVRSDNTNGIACWFIDADYDQESFFVRQAYFPGTANDPYKALKTSLKAEIDSEAWATLNSDVSRPFDPPETGRIAVKVINHLGDEVMKVIRID